jgi:hypothetical protein
MSQGRGDRFAPLTGVVFVVLTIVVFSVGGSTPGDHDRATKVAAFYAKHHDKHTTLAVILAVAVPFLLLFVSSLRQDLRRAGGTGQLANAAFAGGVVAGAGFALLATVHLALADAGASLKTLATTQALNVLDNNDFLPASVGTGLLVLAAGLSVVRHGGLPNWFGWVGVVLGFITFTPAGFFGFLGSGLWILVAAILLTVARGRAPAAA